MSYMISEIHRISDAYSYVPVVTEVSGLITIGGGVANLGISGVLKVDEYYTGRKVTIPYISNDAAQFHAEVGQAALKHGFKRIAPITGVLLTIYVLSARYLTR